MWFWILILDFIVVNQIYEADILKEFVIRGNTGILKCSIPSFVADFVHVDAWLSNDGAIYEPSTKNFGIYEYWLWKSDEW